MAQSNTNKILVRALDCLGDSAAATNSTGGCSGLTLGFLKFAFFGSSPPDPVVSNPNYRINRFERRKQCIYLGNIHVMKQPILTAFKNEFQKIWIDNSFFGAISIGLDNLLLR